MFEIRQGDLKAAAMAMLLWLCTAALLAGAAPTAPLPPDAKLSDEPLFSTTSRVKPNSPQATAGMTDKMKDGFPVYNETAKWGSGVLTGWDPVTASCQRNYVVAIGDLNTHHEHSLPGLRNDGLDGWPDGFRAADLSRMEPDTAFWSSIVGAFENAETVGYTVPGGSAGLTTRGNEAGPRPSR